MTEDLRIAMLHHVRYESSHFAFIPEWRDDAPLLTEAVFLSLFVHARNLIHFFERERKKDDDDVYASDYGFDRVTLPIKSEDRMRFGKEMIHITSKRERHTSQTKPWPIQQTYAVIKPVATRFASHVWDPAGVLLHFAERPNGST